MNALTIIKDFRQRTGMTVDEFVSAARLRSKTPYYLLMRQSQSGVSLTAVDKMLRVCGYRLEPTPIATPTSTPGQERDAECGERPAA